MRIFRYREAHAIEDGRIDANMRKILRLMDGQKSLVSVAFASGMTMSDFQTSVRRLIDLNLIAPIDEIQDPMSD